MSTYNRYFSVTRPLTYRARRTPRRAGIMIAAAWVISLVLWPPWIYAWPYIEGDRKVPEGKSISYFTAGYSYPFFLFFRFADVSRAFPSLLICLSFSFIYFFFSVFFYLIPYLSFCLLLFSSYILFTFVARKSSFSFRCFAPALVLLLLAAPSRVFPVSLSPSCFTSSYSFTRLLLRSFCVCVC